MTTDNKIGLPLASLLRNALILVSCLLLVLAVTPNLAQDYGLVGDTGSTEVSQQSVLPAETDPDEVSYDQALISDWQETRTNLLGEQLARLLRKAPNYPEDFARAMSQATTPEIGWGWLWVLLTMLVITVIGLALEQVTTRKLLSRLYAYVEGREKTVLLKLRFILIRVIIQLTGVAVLALSAYAMVIYTRHGNPFYDLLATEWVSSLVVLRLWMILLRNIFSPNRHGLRPIPLDDDSSRQLYRWFTAFFAIFEFGNGLFI